MAKSVRSKSFTHRTQARLQPVIGGSFPYSKSRDFNRSSFVDVTSVTDRSVTVVKSPARAQTYRNSNMEADTIADDSLTGLKMVTDDSITTTKTTLDDSITCVKTVPNDSLTAAKRVSNGSITDAKTVPNDSLTAAKRVSDGSITSKKTADSITTTKSVAIESITAAKIAENDTGTLRNPVQLSMNIPPDNSSKISSVNFNRESVSVKAFAEATKTSAEETEDDPYWAKRVSVQ